MAHIEPSAPIQDIHGAISKTPNQQHVIIRRKTYRDEHGHVIAQGPKEAYYIQSKRDLKKKPYSPLEEVTHRSLAMAVAETKRILSNPQSEEYLTWRQRFEAQLPPHRYDPEAPFNPQTGVQKKFVRFDCFIRAILMPVFRQQLLAELQA